MKMLIATSVCCFLLAACSPPLPLPDVTTPKETPWLTKPNEGDLSISQTKINTLEISWTTQPAESYDLYACFDINADLKEYVTSGCTKHTNVTPTFTLSNLVIDNPVYLGLSMNGVLSSWTSYTPRTFGALGVLSQVIDSSGTRYLGGNFSAIAPYTGHSAALSLNPGVTHALAFPFINAAVNTVIPDGKGGWYIGGNFQRVGDKARHYLAQIDSVGRVTEWNPGTNGEVKSLSLMNGIVYAGGLFTGAGGGTGTTARKYLAAFDDLGTLTSWNPDVDNTVTALTTNNGVVYAGGFFTKANGNAYTRLSIAGFDSNGNATSFNPGISSPSLTQVLTLTVVNNVIYAGGSFTLAGGGTGITARNNMAAFDTNGNLTSFNPGFNNEVSVITFLNDNLYVGGQFTKAGGGTGITNRNHLATFDTSGNLLSWNPGADGSVSSINIQDSTIYIGGGFTAVGGGTGNTIRHSLAAIDTTGNVLAWNPSTNYGGVYSLVVTDGLAFIGGNFTHVGNDSHARQSLAAFDANGNLTDWNPGTNGMVLALTEYNGIIYAGGSFSGAGGGTGTTTRNNLAAFDIDGNLTSWNPGSNGTVNALMNVSGTMYAGGSFTAVGGGTGTTTRNNLASITNIGNVSTWNPGTNGNVYAIKMYGSTFYIGGSFSQIGGGTGTTSRLKVAAVNSSGAVLSWNPGVYSAPGYGVANVYAIEEMGGVIYIGGWFNKAGGGTGTTDRMNIAGVSTSGTLASWNPGVQGSVRSMASSTDTLYVGGATFDKAGGGTATTDRLNLAAFDSNATLLTWNPGALGYINDIDIYNGDIYIVGETLQSAGEGIGSQPRLGTAIINTVGNVQ